MRAPPVSAMRLDDRLLEETACCLLTSVWTLEAERPARQARKVLREHVTPAIANSRILDDLDVMVCELATNAGLHARGPFELRVLDHAGVPLVVELVDSSPDIDRVANGLERVTAPVALDNIDEAALTVRGRGLSIVARLSGGRCGAHRTRLQSQATTGKGVWFAIPTCPAHCDEGGDPRLRICPARH